MTQRNEVISQIDSQLTPILNGLLADAKGEGLQAPYSVEIYAGSNGITGKELTKFAVEQNSAGEWRWNRDMVNNKLAELASAPETGVYIHVHGTSAKPMEGGLTFEFGRAGASREAEAGA
jgi:hypothetical protein